MKRANRITTLSRRMGTDAMANFGSPPPAPRKPWLERAFFAVCLASLLSSSPAALADALMPLTVEHPPSQTIVLTQGFSTTIRSERSFGKISIANPDIVDLVLRTDKSVVLIPVRIGQTNVDFLDDHGGVIGRINIIVNQQKNTDRVLVHDHPALSGYSSYHCSSSGCEYFEEIPSKEQALIPTVTEEHRLIDTPSH